MCVAHLEVACHFLNSDAFCRKEAVNVAIRVLARAGDQLFHFGPVFPNGQLTEVIRRKGWNDEFEIIAAICYDLLPGAFSHSVREPARI